MDNHQTPDYDAMFRASQTSAHPNESHTVLVKGAYEAEDVPPYTEQVIHPEVLNPDGRPIKPPHSKPSADTFGTVAAILGVVSFILIFLGMFLHFLMWMNVLVCLTGITFGIIALMKQAASRVFGILGIILCIFNLVVEVICIVISIIGSGISALFRLFA